MIITGKLPNPGGVSNISKEYSPNRTTYAAAIEAETEIKTLLGGPE